MNFVQQAIILWKKISLAYNFDAPAWTLEFKILAVQNLPVVWNVCNGNVIVIATRHNFSSNRSEYFTFLIGDETAFFVYCGQTNFIIYFRSISLQQLYFQLWLLYIHFKIWLSLRFWVSVHQAFHLVCSCDFIDRSDFLIGSSE